MKIIYNYSIILLYLKLTSGYLYRFPKPGYKHRIGKIKKSPELIPTQMPFYTKKENNINTTINN